MIITTRKQADEYARTIANLRKESVHVFPVPKGTAGHTMGYRFGTCLDSERAEYERDGARIVGTITPEAT